MALQRIRRKVHCQHHTTLQVLSITYILIFKTFVQFVEMCITYTLHLYSSVINFRYDYEINLAAADELIAEYHEDFMGKIALSIFNYHYDNPVCYELDEEARRVYERIINRFNEQFNLKYSG